MEKQKVIYRGSANRVPKYGIQMKDGDIIEMSTELADKVVSEHIGFSRFEEIKINKDNQKTKKIVKMVK